MPITPIYVHATTFGTVADDIAFGKDGEWTKPRTGFSRFQNVQLGNVDQFRDWSRQPILGRPNTARLR